MQLRNRIGIVILCIVGGAGALALLCEQFIIGRTFENIEFRAARRAYIRAQQGVETRLEDLDTRSHLAGDDPQCIKARMNGSVLELAGVPKADELLRRGIDVVMVVRPSGAVTFSSAVDRRIGREIPLPDEFSRYFFSREELVSFNDLQQKRSGVAVIGGRPLLLVSRPLVCNGPEPEICGAVLAGRFLDQDELAAISESAGSPVQVLGRDAPPPVYLRDVWRRLSTGHPFQLAFTSQAQRCAVGLLPDILAAPTMVMVVDFPHTIFSQARSAFWTFALVLIGVLLLLVPLILRGLDRILLRRFEAILQKMEQFRNQQDCSLRLEPDAGNQDELSQLISEVNYWLVRVQQNGSQRQQLEQELAAAQRKLKETQQELVQSGKLAAMGQLAAGISHELNQPLTGIKGFSQVVLAELGPEDRHRQDIEKIIEQADRMDRIIQNVRLFARRSEFEKKPLDLHEVIDKTLSLMMQQLKVHNIRIIRRFDPQVPNICADFNSMQQVFVNLITNARDAIQSAQRQSGGEIGVTTQLAGDGTIVQVAVSDNGSGIPPETMDDIFNPFFTTKSPHGGMGLGLSIVYRIVEDHRGNIQVASEVDKGTKFTLTFPVNCTPAASVRPAEKK